MTAEGFLEKYGISDCVIKDNAAELSYGLASLMNEYAQQYAHSLERKEVAELKKQVMEQAFELHQLKKEQQMV